MPDRRSAASCASASRSAHTINAIWAGHIFTGCGIYPIIGIERRGSHEDDHNRFDLLLERARARATDPRARALGARGDGGAPRADRPRQPPHQRDRREARRRALPRPGRRSRPASGARRRRRTAARPADRLQGSRGGGRIPVHARLADLQGRHGRWRTPCSSSGCATPARFRSARRTCRSSAWARTPTTRSTARRAIRTT